MPRIPYPDEESLSEAKREYVESMGERMLNVVRLTLHVPDPLWESLRDFMTACVRKSSLTPWQRELMILRVGYISRSDYVLFHHLSIARKLGMDDALLSALESEDYSSLSEEDRAIAEFTDEVVRKVTPSDATLAALRSHFSDAHLMELVTLIGDYMLTARIVGVGRPEPDGAAIPGWDAKGNPIE